MRQQDRRLRHLNRTGVLVVAAVMSQRDGRHRQQVAVAQHPLNLFSAMIDMCTDACMSRTADGRHCRTVESFVVLFSAAAPPACVIVLTYTPSRGADACRRAWHAPDFWRSLRPFACSQAVRRAALSSSPGIASRVASWPYATMTVAHHVRHRHSAPHLQSKAVFASLLQLKA